MSKIVSGFLTGGAIALILLVAVGTAVVKPVAGCHYESQRRWACDDECAIRSYPAWMRYAGCRNDGHTERYCKRQMRLWGECAQ